MVELLAYTPAVPLNTEPPRPSGRCLRSGEAASSPVKDCGSSGLIICPASSRIPSCKAAQQRGDDAVEPVAPARRERVVSLTERRLAELPADERPLPSVA